jgi:hypothetical protein
MPPTTSGSIVIASMMATISMATALRVECTLGALLASGVGVGVGTG